MADGDVSIVTATLTANLQVSYKLERDLGDNIISAISYAPSFTLLNGTGDNQGNRCFRDQRSLTGNEALDLKGVLTDDYGTTLNFDEVIALLVANTAASGSGNIEVGGAAANAFVGPWKDATDIQVVPPGGFYYAAAPYDGAWSVGSNDQLKITASTGTIAYNIIIVGRDDP